MSSEESELSLKAAVEFIVDNRGKTAPTVEKGVALIATNCVNNKDLYPQKLNLRYVSQETYKTWFRAHPQPGDILLTNKGSQNGAVCLVPNPVDFCIAQDMVALRADPKKIYPLFLFAALRSELVQQRMKALNVDAVIPHLKKTDFDKLFIPLPGPESQRWIGDWYFQLCRRIECLSETNATLEGIAQALFKSWFVDFDPVRAKAEGREPEGMDEATAALFPDAFEEPESGLVPKGWRISTVGDSFVLTMGQSPPGDTYSANDNGLPFYQGRTDFGFRFPTKRMYCSAPTRIAEVGDTLVSVRAPVGDVNMALEKCCVGRGVASVRHPKDFRSFTFYAMCGLENHFKNFDSEGTIFGSITKKDFQALPVIAPSLPTLSAYDAIASHIDGKIVENEKQLRTLVTLRDTLLPRLISGKLRIPETTEELMALAA